MLEFPPAASFHRGLLRSRRRERPSRRPLRADRRRTLTSLSSLGEGAPAEEAETEDEPATEEEIIALVQTTFDTRKLGKEGD